MQETLDSIKSLIENIEKRKNIIRSTVINTYGEIQTKSLQKKIIYAGEKIIINKGMLYIILIDDLTRNNVLLNRR